MRRDKLIINDDTQPVMVPRNHEPLVAMPPERVQRLREHLIQELADLRKAKHPERLASPACPGPVGFAARVVQTACSLCQGFCCRNGGDHAFLDDRTLARVRLERDEIAVAQSSRSSSLSDRAEQTSGDSAYSHHAPGNLEMTEDTLQQLYLDRVPSASYRGSCIFHGSHGCTLDRSMRADVCNRYFCGGLDHYMKSGDLPMPAMVIAGEGNKMRTSSVLVP